MNRTFLSTTVQVAAIAGALFLPVLGWADTVPLKADAYFNPGDANAYGGLPTMNVGGVSGSVGLVQFDLSTLPPGTTAASIVWAHVRLYAGKVTTPGAVDILAANASWSEAGVSGLSGVGAGSPVQLGIQVPAPYTYITVDVTSLLQSWLAGAPNNGILISANPSSTSISFDSKENIQTSHPATLEFLLVGPAGSAGLQGPAGAPGPTGPAGPLGPLGAAGPTGAAGLTGPNGPTGVAGPTGPSGPVGAAGNMGPAGPTGATGPSGPIGNTGAQGGPGLSGSAGPQGAGGPSGGVGGPGPLGPSGPSGPSGVAGPSGPVGATGASGAAGPVGTSGPQGIVGIQGPAGLTGASGPSGPSGTSLAYSNLDAFDTTAHASGYVILNTDTHIWFVLTNASSASFITLPAANTHAGKLIYVVGTSAGVGLTIKSASPDLLQPINCGFCASTSSYTIPANPAGIGFFSDGSNWRMLATL